MVRMRMPWSGSLRRAARLGSYSRQKERRAPKSPPKLVSIVRLVTSQRKVSGAWPVERPDAALVTVECRYSRVVMERQKLLAVFDGLAWCGVAAVWVWKVVVGTARIQPLISPLTHCPKFLYILRTHLSLSRT